MAIPALVDQPIPEGLIPPIPLSQIPPASADIDLNQILQNVQNQGLPSLETSTYNKQIIEDLIQKNIFQQNILDPAGINIIHHQGDVKTPERLEIDMANILEVGLKTALTMPDPGQSARQAISTLSEAAHEMDQRGLFNNVVDINQGIVNAVNSEIGMQSLANLHYTELLPPAVITAKFDAAGQHLLQKPNLTVPEMNKISDSYKEIILDLQVHAMHAGVSQRNISNLLRQFSRWTDDHVENEQLKMILKNNARRISSHRLSDLEFRASNLQPEIIPLTVSKSIAIESSSAKNTLAAIPDMVSRYVNNIPDINRAATNLIHIIDLLNKNAFLHRMRIQKPSINGIRPAPELININIRNSDNTVKSINQLKAELKDVTDNFINPRVTILRHATRETDLSGISEDDFIRDLRSVTTQIQRRANKRKVRKSTMPVPHSIKKIGSILIRGDATNKKEIHIKSTAKKEDLMKLVYLLSAEDGTLDDTNHNHILKIKKGEDVAAIYNALMQEFSKNLGGDLILVYHPDSPVGGQFLDGFMSLFNHKSLIPNPPSLLGGNLSLGNITSSGFIHSNPQQQFLNMPLHSFTPFRPAVIRREFENIPRPIMHITGSVSNIKRIPVDAF